MTGAAKATVLAFALRQAVCECKLYVVRGGESMLVAVAQGTIVKMTMRSIILETFDGKWIVVPNEHFITTRVVNYSDQGSANRYDVSFQVTYETDLERVAEVVVPAVAALSGKLRPGLAVVVAADPRTAPAAAQTASKPVAVAPAS